MWLHRLMYGFITLISEYITSILKERNKTSQKWTDEL